jgi:hypothetical protein
MQYLKAAHFVAFGVVALQQSTFGFDVVDPNPTPRVPDAADGSPGNVTYYDAE